MIEVEIRSLLRESMLPKVQEKLARMRLVQSGASLDMYYDTSDYALLRHPQLVFLRLREGRLLQVKFNGLAAESLLPPCIEREFVVETDNVPAEVHVLLQSFLPGWQAASSWQETLHDNHLGELARVDKKRSVYVDDPFIVCIDTVANLGQFLEVEINCPEGSDTRKAQECVDAFLAEVEGIPLKAGYFELYLYYYRLEAYQFVPERFHVEADLLPDSIWKDFHHGNV